MTNRSNNSSSSSRTAEHHHEQLEADYSLAPPLIQLDDGWSKEIKPKAIQILQEILDTGIESKHVRPFGPGEFMPIYTVCYNMCTQRTPFNWSEQLYERHGETIQLYLSNQVLPSLESQHDEFILSALDRRWKNHLIMNKWMNRFFMYLDRYHVKHHNLPTLQEAGLKLFKKIIFDSIKENVVSAVLQVMTNDRENEMVDKTLLRDIVQVFESMGMGTLEVYTVDLEADVVKHTTLYYAQKAQEWMEIDATPQYLIKAEKALKTESLRVQQYLNLATEPKLLRAVEYEVLEKHEKGLLEKENSGCIALLSNDKKEDLARMFRLFNRVPDGLIPIAALVRQHITKMGNAVIDKRSAEITDGTKKESASDPQLISELLALHEEYKQVVNGEFNGHALFQKALKEAFVEFVNHDVGKFSNAEMMSTFCDRILKTGGEKLSEEQVEDKLEQIVQLFSYLTDKDVFCEIYRNQLAKRLLNQRSSSDDAERLMIAKLKLRCGAQFTSKMEGMLNDLAVGIDHQTGFLAYLGQGQNHNNTNATAAASEFSVQVLTTGHWPTYKVLDVTLPLHFIKHTEMFKEYYDTKTSHRRLQWIHSLGQATVKGTFGKRTYDLQVTTLQAITLLLFNECSDSDSDDSHRTFEDIRDALHLSDEIVKRILHSLSCQKYKLLKKSPVSKSILVSDTFGYNHGFSSPMRKIRIPMASLEESHNAKHVEEDRSIAIEAAIVRIMKARKSLGHQQLVSEVLSQLAFFRPKVKIIKKRIEALIDREYLERDPNSTNSYRYLA